MRLWTSWFWNAVKNTAYTKDLTRKDKCDLMLHDYFYNCMNFATEDCSGDCETCKKFETALMKKLKEMETEKWMIQQLDGC